MSVIEDHIVNRVFIIFALSLYITCHSLHSHNFYSLRDMITLGFKGIANLMLKSSLFILFCENDADFHQIATFIL